MHWEQCDIDSWCRIEGLQDFFINDCKGIIRSVKWDKKDNFKKILSVNIGYEEQNSHRMLQLLYIKLKSQSILVRKACEKRPLGLKT